MAERAVKVRKHMHAAMKCAETFHCEVEDLVDMEETTEDVNQKPKWRFDLEEKEC